MRAVAVQLVLCCVIHSTLAYSANLTGHHYDITIIHDPPGVDVGLNDGVIWPKAQWKGYIIDMIAQISVLADFSYELHLPSGNGSRCTGNATVDSKGYLCGQQVSLFFQGRGWCSLSSESARGGVRMYSS